jgi:tetratricopeptide (TPR) repeat protein
MWLWMAGVLAVLILLLMLASTLASAERSMPEVNAPARLPATVQLLAEPLPGMPGDVSPSWEDANGIDPALDMVKLVWTVMEDHRRGEFEAALEGWNSVQFDYDTDFYRMVAIGHANLVIGNLEGAKYALSTAEEMAPNNAVVHYFLGVLRLEEAALAHDWYDAVGPTRTRFVSYVPRDVVPNSRSMYLLAARSELERAIELAPTVRLDEPLTPEAWYTTMALGPTVGDLLLAMGAENFAAKAHNLLAPMLLENGLLEAAETHLDAAVRGGMYVGFGYVDLIGEYEDRGHYLDAARVCAKAVDHGLDEKTGRQRALMNLERMYLSVKPTD